MLFFPALVSAFAVLSVGSPSPPTASLLPTIDPQARQILADMVNMYNGFSRSSPEKYADVETIQATGDTKAVSPQYINNRFTVALSNGDGVALTATDASGAKVMVHAFQQFPSRGDSPFLVITTDSRFPKLYVKDVVPDYNEARDRAFSRAGLGTFGAGALFSEKDIGSLLLVPAFHGLSMGPTATVDGVTCDALVFDLGDNSQGSNTITCDVGQQDHLLRRLLVVHVEGGQATTVVTENHTHIRTQSFTSDRFMLPFSSFRCAPPPGARQVKSFPYPPVPVR